MTRLDRNPNEQPAVEEWRTYGSIIDSLVWVPNGVKAFLDALASGDIRARLVSPPTSPPPTKHPILDAADPSSPDFWRAFEDAELGHAAVEQNWTSWLRIQVEVQWEPASAIYRNAIQRTTWNDLQTLAWFASQDGWLVAKMANIANGDDGARQELLGYLGSYVSMRHCRCGGGNPQRCRCLDTACEKLVGSLQTKDLHAVLLRRDGRERRVSREEIRTAPLDQPAATFQLTEDSGQLLFDESEVRSAADLHATPERSVARSTEPKPTSKTTRKRRGRREIDDSGHIETMHKWLAQNPGKIPRDAAKIIEAEVNKKGVAIAPDSFLRRLVDKYERKYPRWSELPPNNSNFLIRGA